jgi:hypothetical protein
MNDLDLLTSIARSEGLQKGNPNKKLFYNPLYKHPLPISDHRFSYEASLRKILSSDVSFQGISAIIKGDAWSLEEVYLRHGWACLKDKDGVPPLHIAVQLNQSDCVQVLLNIGVDVNQPNEYGFPPLYVAKSGGFWQIAELLISKGALATVHQMLDEAPETTALEVYPENHYGTGRKNKSEYKKKDCQKLSRSVQYY